MMRLRTLIGASLLLWAASVGAAGPPSAPTPRADAATASASAPAHHSVGRADAPADAAAIRPGSAFHLLTKSRIEPVSPSASHPPGPPGVGSALWNATVPAGAAHSTRRLHLLHSVWLR